MVLRTALYFIPSAMTGFIVSVFPFRNRVSFKEAFEGLELGEGKPSRPVLRGPGGCKAVRLLGSNSCAEVLGCIGSAPTHRARAGALPHRASDTTLRLEPFFCHGRG